MRSSACRALSPALVASLFAVTPFATTAALHAQPGGAPAAAASDRPTAHAPRVTTLDNGLQVIVAEDHSAPLMTADLVVRNGAMTQTPDDQGIPHLFEHMLFKGYRGVGDRHFGSDVAEIQAGYNGTTSEEMVTYYLTGPSGGAADAIRILARLARDARFEPEDLRTERFVVLGEMQRGESDPRARLERDLGRALWGDGFYRKNTIGEATALLGVRPDRLAAIYARYYVPNNAALVVTGDVDAARVLEAARRHFGPWRRQVDPFAAGAPADPPPLAAPVVVVEPGPVDAVTVVVQWQGPSVKTDREDTYAADVLAEVVDDEQSGMTKRLVDGGNFQSVHVGYETLAHTGPITFRGVTTADRLDAALTVLANELEVLRAPDYFDAPSLAAAAKRRRVYDALEAEVGSQLAHALGEAWAVSGLDYHLGYADALARQTPADLHRVVTRYLARPFVMGAVVPAGRERAAGAMLQQFVEFVRPEKP